ncbi:MAG: peptidylprolyl isomerase [Bacteroidota bacterium]
MKIAEKTVVSLNYTLKNAAGQILDTSEGREPLVYMHGVGALIPGLEKDLTGKEKGEKFQAVVEAKDAYGEVNQELIKVVNKSGFQGDEELKVGMQVQISTDTGHNHIASVTAIEGENVTLDLNHPLAGQQLFFDVEVVDIREATAEEIDHGHPHGPGGHQH